MIKQEDFPYQLDMSVRDYECDMQGIVNNSVYQNYMEHTRHEYIKTLGLDFAALTAEDIILVVARIEIAYKNSLRSSDNFVSCCTVCKKGVRYIFEQAIFDKESGTLIATGKVTSVARVRGKLATVEKIDAAIAHLG